MLSAPQSVNVTHLREDFSAALLLWLELLGSSLTSESLSPSPALGTLSSIALNGGEGRGEEALIKTSHFATLQSLWFVGSNVKIPANRG